MTPEAKKALDLILKVFPDAKVLPSLPPPPSPALNARQGRGRALPEGTPQAGAVPSLEAVNRHNCNPGWVLRGRKGNHSVYISMRCKRWTCSYCGPRKLHSLRIQCEKEALRLKLDKMMSLTLRPGMVGGYDLIKKYWAKFRARLKKKYPEANYQFMAFVEPQKRGAAHLHILHNLFIPQAWISRVWEECGGGRIVDVRRQDIHHASFYLTKYLTKSFFLDMKARYRRVTCSRGVSLRPAKRFTDYSWNVLKYDFNQAFDRFSGDGHLRWSGGEYFETTVDPATPAPPETPPLPGVGIYLHRRGKKKKPLP